MGGYYNRNGRLVSDAGHGYNNATGIAPSVDYNSGVTSYGAVSITDQLFAPYYSAGWALATPAATATDFATIAGSAAKVIYVNKITLVGLATTIGTLEAYLILRSALDTAGISSTLTAGKHDTLFGTAAATVKLYSANPSALGTAVGTVAIQGLNCGLTGATGLVVFDFAKSPVVLRGAAANLAINFNGATIPTGGKVGGTIEWFEI